MDREIKEEGEGQYTDTLSRYRGNSIVKTIDRRQHFFIFKFRRLLNE